MLDRIQAFFPLPRIGTCASDVHSVTQNALRLSCSVSKRVIDIRRYGQWDTVTSASIPHKNPVYSNGVVYSLAGYYF